VKEIPWTKSTGLWTKGDGNGPWSILDRASYPFDGSNLGHSIWNQQLRIEEVGAAAATGGAAGGRGSAITDGLPEWCSGGWMLTVNGLGGGGDDGEPISR
jgi:hypothetical protein